MSTDAHLLSLSIGSFSDRNCKVLAAVIMHKLAEMNGGASVLVWADAEGNVFCGPASLPIARHVISRFGRQIIGKYTHRADRPLTSTHVVEDLECARDQHVEESACSSAT